MLVVCGGLTGLSSAVFLATHGMPCVVLVESHLGLLIYILSAVRGINPRTVELFRQVRSEPAIHGRQKLC